MNRLQRSDYSSRQLLQVQRWPCLDQVYKNLGRTRRRATINMYYDFIPKGVLFTYKQEAKQATRWCKIRFTKEAIITAPHYLLFAKVDGIYKLSFTADELSTNREVQWISANIARMLTIYFNSNTIINLVLLEERESRHIIELVEQQFNVEKCTRWFPNI